MTELLLAVFIYTVVFGADYLFYTTHRSKYNYVSRRTYTLFIGGQIAVIWLFFSQLRPFLENIYTELVFIGILFLVLVLFSYFVSREKLLICNSTSRTERCLTPGYVLVKGADIVFQQMIYAAIALSLVSILGTNILTYVSFIAILLIIHTPVILSTNKQAFYVLTLGLAVFSVPFMYVFTELMLFWPAVYVHSLSYTFMWLAFADMEGRTVEN